MSINILTLSFTIICLVGTIMTMNTQNQGSFIGGLSVGYFWLGWLLKSEYNLHFVKIVIGNYK